jgi:pimeloyl-ACP methyl ester carboxylesterase
MSSITDPFTSVNFFDLPPLSKFTARDGTKLAYRAYASAAATPGQGSVVLIHGSSATSSSMHPMAKALSAAGYPTYALDIRGHGGSGRKGQIAYVGQLEDDLADFTRAVSPPKPVTLAGFSSGGGFAARFAGSNQQQLFQSYLMLAPFLSHDAPTMRPDAGGWASVSVPRIIAIAILNGFGVRTSGSPLRRKREHKGNPDSGIFVFAGNELWSAKRLLGGSPFHAPAVSRPDRRERRGLLSRSVCRRTKAGWQRYSGHSGTWCRSHPAYFVAGSL